MLVVREGRIAGEVSGDEMTEDRIMYLASIGGTAAWRREGGGNRMTMTTPSENDRARPGRHLDTLRRLLRMRETGLVLIILALFVVMSFASPYFLTWNNMRAMAMAFAVEGIVVVGMTILLISGGIDLSVGSVTALAMVIAGPAVPQRYRSVDGVRRWRSPPAPPSARRWASSSPASACTISSCRWR